MWNQPLNAISRCKLCGEIVEFVVKNLNELCEYISKENIHTHEHADETHGICDIIGYKEIDIR